MASLFEALHWTDANAHRAHVTLIVNVAAIVAAAKELDALAGGLSSLAEKGSQLCLGLHTTARATARAAQEVPSLGACDRLRALPTMLLPSGQTARILNLKEFSVDDFDWACTIPEVDMEQANRGRSAADYLAFVASGDWATFCGTDPVFLDRGADGRIDIIDGRHRLWAALKLGLTVPVQVSRSMQSSPSLTVSD